MTGLLADSIHALRIYRGTPVASLIAVGVLAVGVAFVGAFLSLYVDLALRPHPGIERSGGLVTVAIDGGATRFGMLERMQAEVTSLEVIAGVQNTALEIGAGRAADYVALVTRDFFPGIRPKLALGRGFEDTDHARDAAPVAVISDAFWRDRFDRSPDVLDRVVDIHPRSWNSSIRVVDGRPEIVQADEERDGPTAFRIVGVMAPTMPGLWGTETALWAPLERAVRLIAPAETLESALRGLSVSLLGRRAPGASAAGVAAELQARFRDFDEFNLRPDARFDAIDGIVRSIDAQRDARRQLQLFLIGSLLLAMVAAANVSLFLLARAPGRRRELGIRLSVGAPMMRLARQLANEAGLLVAASAALGLIMSVWLSGLLRGLSFLSRAEWDDVRLLDWRVLGLVGGFLLLVALAVSIAPILGLRRLGIAAAGRQATARATLAQRIAGTAQIAMAGAVGGAGLAFAWYLGSLILAYPGYETDDLYVVDYLRSSSFAGQDMGLSISLLPVADQERLRESFESLPSVDGVAFGGPVPGSGTGRGLRAVAAPDDPNREIAFAVGTIDSRFIEMLGFRLLYGRAPRDNEVGVAVTNRTGAQAYFGRDDVVGEILPLAQRGDVSSEIIGVLDDLAYRHPADEVEPLAYLTASLDGNGARATVIKSSRSVAELQQDLKGLIDAGELEVDGVELTHLGQLRSAWLAPDRERGYLTILTMSLVVLLAAFGFYGTQRYLVAAGRREYAIRASLGAGPGALGRLVLRRGVAMSLPGLAIGGLLAFIAVAWLRDDFGSREVPAGAVAAAVVAGLAALLLIASLGPARDARATQPASLLRDV